MRFFKENRSVLIIFIPFLIVLLACIIYWYIGNQKKFNQNNEEYVMTPKKYGVNEYSLVSIDDGQMANIYLNDYRNLLLSDRIQSYNLLNKEYKDLKFPSIESFNQYINTINFSSLSVDKYGTKRCGKNICYYIYDKSGKEYIFRIFNVMEYEVYLDEDTVEIR